MGSGCLLGAPLPPGGGKVMDRESLLKLDRPLEKGLCPLSDRPPDISPSSRFSDGGADVGPDGIETTFGAVAGAFDGAATTPEPGVGCGD